VSSFDDLLVGLSVVATVCVVTLMIVLAFQEHFDIPPEAILQIGAF
jgi:hypothetical protein